MIEAVIAYYEGSARGFNCVYGSVIMSDGWTSGRDDAPATLSGPFKGVEHDCFKTGAWP